MKAIRFHELGGPEVLRVEEVPDPVPGPGELLIRVRAVGVNFADTLFRRGSYFVRPVFPQIVGSEAAGEVIAQGPPLDGAPPAPAVGARVMVLAPGAYAELMVAKPEQTYPMAEGLDFVPAAALPVQGLTAYHLLTLSGRMDRGERVLVHAAAGGVGTLAVQLAKQLGASLVIATAGSPEKLELARSLGADVALDYRQPDWEKQVKGATQGRGVDVILEMVGGAEMLKKNLGCLAALGRLVVFGAASGDTKATLEPVALMAKNLTVTGYYLTPLLRQRALCEPPLLELGGKVARDELKVIVGESAPLADAARLHGEIEGRRTVGKLVLVP